METLSISVTLFLIMDPLGNLPIFMSILEGLPEERQRKVLIRELFLALAVITIFLFGGKYVMAFLGLKEESVSVAGGIVLFLIAVKMIFPKRENGNTDLDGEPLLVPLAIPLIAGPSLLAALMLFSTTSTIGAMQLFLAAFIAWVGNFFILISAPFIARLLTKKGLIAIERLMGMILVAISVQMFLSGVSKVIK
ncbi:MAG: YhgN family NAAT transporter [Candidatus Zixiibacteriota bacterium]